MTENPKVNLKEAITKERLRRKRLKEIEESNFKIDNDIKDDGLVSDLIRQIDAKEYPVHEWLCDLAERMGFELKTVASDNTHFYLLKDFQLFVNPNNETYQLLEIFKSGTEFSHSVEYLIEEKKKYILEIFSEVIFLAPDRVILRQIEKDKIAWNKLYGRKLEKWK